MKSITDGIPLRVLGLRLEMTDTRDGQVELVSMIFGASAELPPAISENPREWNTPLFKVWDDSRV